jgi:hypothetical protein
MYAVDGMHRTKEAETPAYHTDLSPDNQLTDRNVLDAKARGLDSASSNVPARRQRGARVERRA